MEKDLRLKLLKGWKKTDEKYALDNDQGLTNVDNLVCPCGETISLFKVEEEPTLGRHMFDKMLRDYSKITSNLKLLYVGKFKIKENNLSSYIIKEQISKNHICHLLFVYENVLYVFIFKLNVYFPSLKKIISSNQAFKDVVALLEAQF